MRGVPGTSPSPAPKEGASCVRRGSRGRGDPDRRRAGTFRPRGPGWPQAAGPGPGPVPGALPHAALDVPAPQPPVTLPWAASLVPAGPGPEDPRSRTRAPGKPYLTDAAAHRRRPLLPPSAPFPARRRPRLPVGGVPRESGPLVGVASGAPPPSQAPGLVQHHQPEGRNRGRGVRALGFPPDRRSAGNGWVLRPSPALLVHSERALPSVRQMLTLASWWSAKLAQAHSPGFTGAGREDPSNGTHGDTAALKTAEGHNGQILGGGGAACS